MLFQQRDNTVRRLVYPRSDRLYLDILRPEFFLVRFLFFIASNNIHKSNKMAHCTDSKAKLHSMKRTKKMAMKCIYCELTASNGLIAISLLWRDGGGYDRTIILLHGLLRIIVWLFWCIILPGSSKRQLTHYMTIQHFIKSKHFTRAAVQKQSFLLIFLCAPFMAEWFSSTKRIEIMLKTQWKQFKWNGEFSYIYSVI